MTTIDQAISGAKRHARSAALTDRGITACPYPADGTPAQRTARQAWIAQYLRSRPPTPGAVDFRSDLDALAAGDQDDADTVEAEEPPARNVLMTLLEAMGPDGARLKRYWTKGAGAAKIEWGSSGDFMRCVAHLEKHVSDAKGLCNVYHQAAVGAPPGKGH